MGLIVFPKKEWNMKNAINTRLPNDIYIREVEIVDESFHSRFNAIKKEYKRQLR